MKARSRVCCKCLRGILFSPLKMSSQVNKKKFQRSNKISRDFKNIFWKTKLNKQNLPFLSESKIWDLPQISKRNKQPNVKFEHGGKSKVGGWRREMSFLCCRTTFFVCWCQKLRPAKVGWQVTIFHGKLRVDSSRDKIILHWWRDRVERTPEVRTEYWTQRNQISVGMGWICTIENKGEK